MQPRLRWPDSIPVNISSMVRTKSSTKLKRIFQRHFTSIQRKRVSLKSSKVRRRTPVFIGGRSRWLVEKYLRKKLKHKKLSEDQIVAETDKSPGVLMASGYIAGGALAAIVIAILQGVPKQGLANFNRAIEDWSTTHNPLFGNANGDLLSMIPFLILMLLLYLVGREVILKTRKGTS